MNTENFFLFKNLDINPNSIGNLEISNIQIEEIQKYVEITRFIQEIELLFRIYRNNLSILLSTYNLSTKDIINRKIDLQDEHWTDYSIINALTINLISSGKTLVEAINVFFNFFYGKNSMQCENFKKNYISNEYDGRFGYRLLTRLRDFSQHGHLPVSLIETEDGQKACFNLDRIIETPNYDHNKTILNELNHIREDIYIKHGNTAQIAYTLTVAQYNLSLTTIYSSFYTNIKTDFSTYKNNIEYLITKNPDMIIKTENLLNGMIGYIVDDILHVFNPKENSSNMFAKYSETADSILSEN